MKKYVAAIAILAIPLAAGAAQAECTVVNQDLEQRIAEDRELRARYTAELVRDMRQLRDAALLLSTYGEEKACETVAAAIQETLTREGTARTEQPAGAQEQGQQGGKQQQGENQQAQGHSGQGGAQNQGADQQQQQAAQGGGTQQQGGNQQQDASQQAQGQRGQGGAQNQDAQGQQRAGSPETTGSTRDAARPGPGEQAEQQTNQARQDSQQGQDRQQSAARDAGQPAYGTAPEREARARQDEQAARQEQAGDGQQASEEEAARARLEAAVPLGEVSGGLRTEEIVGTDIRGIDDRQIGEIHDVIVGIGEQDSFAIVGVGGFLGLGEEQIAIPFSEIMISSGGDVFYVALTEEQLEQAPRFERDSDWIDSATWRERVTRYFETAKTQPSGRE